jgi:hypothetical protein
MLLRTVVSSYVVVWWCGGVVVCVTSFAPLGSRLPSLVVNVELSKSAGEYSTVLTVIYRRAEMQQTVSTVGRA